MCATLKAITAAAALSFPALAGAALPIREGTQITGVTGIFVNGSSYDVTFLDGTCSELFNGCDSNEDFVFTSRLDATLAAQALADQAFRREWYFPAMTFGCGDPEICGALIPYNSDVDVMEAIGVPGTLDRIVFVGGRSPNLNTIQSDGLVWAVFALTSPAASPVPEPMTWAMMLMGFGAVGYAMRRRKQTKLTIRRAT